MTTPLTVDGRVRQVAAEPDTPLLWVLRGKLKALGTKYGCGIGQCGACTVLLDGEPVRSCSVPLAAVGAKAVTTVEALTGAAVEALRAAWVELDVSQCGWCQSGQIVSATALLTRTPRPTDADIDAAMAGNLCRCGTYPRIRAAIHAAAQRLPAAAAPPAAVAASAPDAATSAAPTLAASTPTLGAAPPQAASAATPPASPASVASAPASTTPTPVMVPPPAASR